MVKAGATLKNSNGFSLTEVLISFGLVTMLVITIFPISVQLEKEQQKLSDRIAISTTLYDELQDHIWNTSPDMNYEMALQEKQLHFHFTTSNNLLKGCVEWTNVKQEKEKTCLFGYPI